MMEWLGVAGLRGGAWWAPKFVGGTGSVVPT